MAKHRVPLFVGLLVLLALTASSSSTTVGAPSKGQKTRGPAPKALKALEALEPRALSLFPASFGGLWLDGRTIFIAFTEGGEQNVALLAKRFPKPKRLQAVPVDDSLAALRSLQAQMNADRQASPVTITEPGPLRPVQVSLAYDLDIDVKRNIVVAIVERPVTPTIVTAFAQRYGDDVVVEQGVLAKPDALFVCQSRFSCAYPLRSGLNTDAQSGTSCSTAFTVSYLNEVKKTVFGVLSAAHCGNPDADVGDARSHDGMVYGDVVAEQEQGRVDAELHSVKGQLSPDTKWSAKAPWIYVDDPNKRGPVAKVGTYSGLPIGSDVCKSGITTNMTCGVVLSKFYVPGSYVVNGMDFVKASYCSEPGDSGAGIYHPYKTKDKTGKQITAYEALGIHSGGAESLCGDKMDYGVFSHIEHISDALKVKVYTQAP